MHSPTSKLQRVSIAGAAALLSGCILLATANTASAASTPAASAPHHSQRLEAAGHFAAFAPLQRAAKAAREATNPKPKSQSKQQSKPVIQTAGFATAIIILVIGERDRLFRRPQPDKNTGG